MGSRGRVGWGVIVAILSCAWLGGAATAQDAGGELKPGKGRISGVIVLEDGTSAKVKGHPYTDLYGPRVGANPGNISFSSQNECLDKFSIDIGPGTVWMKYFTDGYAPAYLGPLEVAVGQKVDNLRLVLKAGKKSTLRMVSGDGKPVRRAKILAIPIVVVGGRHGPSIFVETNDKGEHLFEHLADLPYSFEVTAPGYEPFSVENETLPANEVTELAMTRSSPATGTVFNFDGTPAKGAKIALRSELRTDGHNRSGGYGYGEGMATTDNEGRFTLDQLSNGSLYMFVVESTDKSRVIVRTLRAGIEGVQIRLPKDQNLRVKLIGDLSQLPLVRGQRKIGVRQRVEHDGGKHSQSDLLGEDAVVTPTEDGGVVNYKGLVSGTVQVRAGNQEVTANVVENGPTEVTIDLGKGKAR